MKIVINLEIVPLYELLPDEVKYLIGELDYRIRAACEEVTPVTITGGIIAEEGVKDES